MPSQSVSSTPYELWHGKKPNFEHLRPWGLVGYVHNTNHKYGKLGPRSRKHTFIRYPEGSKGYVMFGERPDGGKAEVDSHNVDFIENDFPSIGDVNESLDLYELEELSSVPLSSSEGGELVPEIATDSGNHSQPSGSVPVELSEPLELTVVIEVTFLVVTLRLRGMPYFVLLMSLLIERCSLHLLRENGWIK